MHSTFAFAKIVIIQSLEECEHPTGERLRDALAALNGELGQSVPVELRTCESAVGFRAIVDELTEAASVGQIPSSMSSATETSKLASFLRTRASYRGKILPLC